MNQFRLLRKNNLRKKKKRRIRKTKKVRKIRKIRKIKIKKKQLFSFNLKLELL